MKTIRLNCPVIAITGSAGKTSTKEMLASILKTRWNVLKSVDNWNYFLHTRKLAARIQPSHRALVLEYGMSGKGHIKKHCQIIEPNYAIITNIGSAHLGAFGGNVKKLALAKSELIRWMKPTGIAVLNADDENTSLIDSGRFRGKFVRIGIDREADYTAQNVRQTGNGMRFQVRLRGHNEHFWIPVQGRHHVYNALCAIAVADLLKFSPEEIRRGLRNYVRLRRRTTVYRFPGNRILIDDSYSSNPDAARAAIDTLEQIGKHTKIAVLGSMRALGSYTVTGHEGVGEYLAEHDISRLYTYGRLARHIGSAAVEQGFPANRVQHFASRPNLHRALLRHLGPNTTILVKGSHGVRMMETADYLRKELGRRSVKKKGTTGGKRPTG